MLNEKQIKALKNGAYGITRDGRKALYAGSYFDTGEHRWLHFSKDNSNRPQAFVGRYDEFDVFYKGDTDSFDIVGLWEDKPEPFNLERALAGEPVKLKNGLKAFVIADLSVNGKQELSRFLDRKHLVGFAEYNTVHLLQWSLDGNDEVNTDKSYSIVGMWKEPEPVQLIADDLPKPIKDFGDLENVWRIRFSHNANKYTPIKHGKTNGKWVEEDYITLSNGCYFATEEDAQANCDWLMNR